MGPDRGRRAVPYVVSLEQGWPFSFVGLVRTAVESEGTLPTLGEFRGFDSAYRRLPALLLDDETLPRIRGWSK